MSILSDKKRYEHTYSCNTGKNTLFLQHDRRYPPKVSIKRLPIKNGGLTVLNGRIPPEEHRTLFGLSLKLRSARGPTDRIPQICQRAARYLGDLTGNIAGETRKKQGRLCSTYHTARPRSPSRTPKTPAAPEALHIIHSFPYGSLAVFQTYRSQPSRTDIPSIGAPQH